MEKDLSPFINTLPVGEKETLLGVEWTYMGPVEGRAHWGRWENSDGVSVELINGSVENRRKGLL